MFVFPLVQDFGLILLFEGCLEAEHVMRVTRIDANLDLEIHARA